jgi:hypothetical protein
MLVAKCTPPYFAKHMEREAAVYNRLRPIQGVHIPVHLVIMKLPHPHHNEGIVDLAHTMLLYSRRIPIRDQLLSTELMSSTRTSDLRMYCLADQVIFIDFDRAKMQPARKALGVISPSRKRKRDERGLVNTRDNVKHTYCSETYSE